MQHLRRHHHNTEARQRSYTAFLHLSKHVCRRMFCLLHAIFTRRLVNVKAHILANGLTSRVHGNTRRLPVHALSLDDRQNIVQYIRNYAEVNAILLPGRVPGYKCDDVQLLPAATTKRQVWTMFTESLRSLATPGRTVTYAAFCQAWKHFLPKVLITKPRSDLCWVCQKNTTTIMRAVNQPEEEKSTVSTTTVVDTKDREKTHIIPYMYMYSTG